MAHTASVKRGASFLLVGGFDGLRTFDSVYSYDSCNEKWIRLEERLAKARDIGITAFLVDQDMFNRVKC